MNDVNIDWTQAPEDATHYLPEYDHLNWSGDYWYKKVGNDWWLVPCEEVLAGCWEWSIDDWAVELFEPLLIRRPISFNPEDSVEVRCNGWSDWQIGTLKYKSDEYAIVLHEYGEQIYVPYQSGFEMRSPMSEEDKQRQKVISEMERVLSIHTDTISDEDIELVCKVLYDEWYSKHTCEKL